jgi:Cu-Zn family superoxide dismutase
MKRIYILLTTLVLILTTSCKKDKKDAEKKVEEVVETVEVKKIKATLSPKSDSKVSGNVVFTEENGVVSMVAIMDGLSPGEHAIHLHEEADCTSADGKSTGGHWNPTFTDHGKWGAVEGYHKGDIGNFIANDKGQATVNFSTDEWCIGCGDPNKDITGKAVIVHQGVDDFVSQPSGAAGARVSCAGIIE